MSGLDRRQLFRAGAAGAGAVALGTSLSGCVDPPPYVPPPNGTAFTLGVVSGLHSSSEVVLWTRVEPALADGVDALEWVVASDPGLTTVVASGDVGVGPESDHTVKVLAGGLRSNTRFWYRFNVAGGTAVSPIGVARTLPTAADDPQRLSLVFASCQNWEGGWYNAWSAIANEDIDAVVWLGDYIYESSSYTLGIDSRTGTTQRATDLPTYRAKYRQYRSDPLVQVAHARHPMAPIWDDHEVFNDYTRLDLVSSRDRVDSAYRAWFEYMPVWPIDGTRIHRRLSWGRLAEIFLLDTRQYRDPQATWPGPSYVGAGDAVIEAGRVGRTILGAEQRSWLLDGLGAAQNSDVRWKLVGNQVMISPVRVLDLDTPEFRRLDPTLQKHMGVYINMDSWDSYQAERDQLLGFLADQRISDVSFLTGDIHCFWQSTMRADFDDDASPLVANEFVCGSISSTGPNIVGDVIPDIIEDQPLGWSPPFRYVDFRHNGYGLLECTPDRMTVNYRTSYARHQGWPTETTARFALRAGDPTPTLSTTA